MDISNEVATQLGQLVIQLTQTQKEKQFLEQEVAALKAELAKFQPSQSVDTQEYLAPATDGTA